LPARVLSEATGDAAALRRPAVRRLAVHFEAEIRRRATAMLSLLQLEKRELSVLLTDDDQIQKLNKMYRAKDRPTDVLAFAMREGDFAALAGELLGDVIISIPTARRQAEERGVEPLAEVTMLLAHGLLHLLGWDHETARKDHAMRAEVERLCAHAVTKTKTAAVKKKTAPPARKTRKAPKPTLSKNRSAKRLT
jgi:probable rRNA maturation factor